MKLAVIVLAVLMIGIASAETIKFGNYTAEFDMKQPHIIEGTTIKTYDGKVSFYNGTFELLGVVIGDYKKNIISYDQTTDLCHIFPIELSSEGAHLTSGKLLVGGVQILSSMNLTNTIEFLDTLKIKKINQAA